MSTTTTRADVAHAAAWLASNHLAALKTSVGAACIVEALLADTPAERARAAAPVFRSAGVTPLIAGNVLAATFTDSWDIAAHRIPDPAPGKRRGRPRRTISGTWDVALAAALDEPVEVHALWGMLRRQANYTQEGLNDLLGVKPTCVQRWEAGRSVPPESSHKRLLVALSNHVTVDQAGRLGAREGGLLEADRDTDLNLLVAA